MSTAELDGRGTRLNPANRYEALHVERADADDADLAGSPAPTEVFRDASRRILAENDSPDIPFRFSLNPYRGCEHGCVYCYARPSHEYLGFSAGLDFERKLMVKTDAPDLLRETLALPAGVPRDSFFVGNMIPTCVCDDRAAGAAVMRRVLRSYVQLPNYQQYWIEAGYADEMHAIQKALAERRTDDILPLMSDRWLNDVTLFGPPARIRDGVEAWRAAGVKTPILVPSSTRGGQLEALREIFAVFE